MKNVFVTYIYWTGTEDNYIAPIGNKIDNVHGLQYCVQV